MPDDLGAGGRWALDHLFLDQDVIPTLVDVKRSSDARIRREVVGQMLDYAANAVAYLPVESLQARLRQTCAERGQDPDAIVGALLERELDPGLVDSFWQQVKTNLQAGRIRMIFVADQIPSELRRVIEFLNRQMDPAEVLAVEIKQYVGEGLTTLVPQVFGQTEAARQTQAAVKGTRRALDVRNVPSALAGRFRCRSR